MEHSKHSLLSVHISCHEETAGRNGSLCDCWSSCWGPPRALQKRGKSCNSVHDHLLAQILSNYLWKLDRHFLVICSALDFLMLGCSTIKW